MGGGRSCWSLQDLVRTWSCALSEVEPPHCSATPALSSEQDSVTGSDLDSNRIRLWREGAEARRPGRRKRFPLGATGKTKRKPA